MTGCLNGGSCSFDDKKDTFSCSCKLPWIGEDCGVKTGEKKKYRVDVKLEERALYQPYN